MTEAGVNSPLGPLTVMVEGGELTALSWRPATGPDCPLSREGAAQLTAYFEGRLMAFDLPLRPSPKAVVARVQAQMRAIPFGETRTYGDLAASLGLPAQAIGQACGANTLPILVPCHRVLGANGLGGFSGTGGVETKVALLKHEGAAGLLI